LASGCHLSPAVKQALQSRTGTFSNVIEASLWLTLTSQVLTGAAEISASWGCLICDVDDSVRLTAMSIDFLAHNVWSVVPSTGWHTSAHMLDKGCQGNNLGLFMFSHMLINIISLWRVWVIPSRRVTDMNMCMKRFSHRIPCVSPCRQVICCSEGSALV